MLIGGRWCPPFYPQSILRQFSARYDFIAAHDQESHDATVAKSGQSHQNRTMPVWTKCDGSEARNRSICVKEKQATAFMRLSGHLWLKRRANACVYTFPCRSQDRSVRNSIRAWGFVYVAETLSVIYSGKQLTLTPFPYGFTLNAIRRARKFFAANAIAASLTSCAPYVTNGACQFIPQNRAVCSIGGIKFSKG